MKTKIIPAINAQSFEEIKGKINLLKELVHHFHLDVASLEFTGYQTWQNPEDLNNFSATFDLHLMISLKPQGILKWNKENVETFILHLEASPNPDGLLKMAKKLKKRIFIAWSPNIEFEFIQKYLNYVDGVLILGVNPGRAGQQFLETTYDRIEKINGLRKSAFSLRQSASLKIMVDGGVNEKNFEKILSYQPDYIIMASAIYNTENPKETYLKFKNMI